MSRRAARLSVSAGVAALVTFGVFWTAQELADERHRDARPGGAVDETAFLREEIELDRDDRDPGPFEHLRRDQAECQRRLSQAWEVASGNRSCTEASDCVRLHYPYRPPLAVNRSFAESEGATNEALREACGAPVSLPPGPQRGFGTQLLCRNEKCVIAEVTSHEMLLEALDGAAPE